MSEKEKKEFRDLLRQVKEEFSNDKNASKQFLVDAGIITKEGKVTEQYEHLPHKNRPDIRLPRLR